MDAPAALEFVFTAFAAARPQTPATDGRYRSASPRAPPAFA
jgi:hypothetical protein